MLTGEAKKQYQRNYMKKKRGSNIQNANILAGSNTVELDPHMLLDAPINSLIYDKNIQKVQELANSIRESGVITPLIVNYEYVIISGNTRNAAAKYLRKSTVPCLMIDVKVTDPRFAKLVALFNTQRDKTPEEILREELAKTDTKMAYRQLVERREQKSKITIETVEFGIGKRCNISNVKSEFAQAVIAIVNDLRIYWSLSVRQIFYRLLNIKPMRNTKLGIQFGSNKQSYQDLSDILTRLRTTGEIPMDSIGDDTRPSVQWECYQGIGGFARKQLDELFQGYWRDLQRSQPYHIEVLAEKLTVESIIRPVCLRYTIPYTIGRGYDNPSTRHKMVKRYRKSGKNKMVLIVLSDFDPEGMDLMKASAKYLTSDFWDVNVELVRAGLTMKQVERFNVHHNCLEAKKTSSKYKKFVAEHGKKVYELEALAPEQLQQILTETIDSVLDVEAYNQELEKEEQDAAKIEVFRKTFLDTARGLLPKLSDVEE